MNRILLALSSVKRRTFLKILLPIAIIVAWEVIAIVLDNQFILPRLGSVLAVLLHPTADILGNGNLIDNALISLERVIAGFLVAAAIAIPLGIGMGRSETVHDLFDSLMQMLRPIPPLAWVPLALAWFKIGLVSMVFIIGMEEGILPHYKSIDDPTQLEEERRLCYVGITRAKQKVYLVRAFRRHLMGSSAVNKPSRFLLDIPFKNFISFEIYKTAASAFIYGLFTQRKDYHGSLAASCRACE